MSIRVRMFMLVIVALATCASSTVLRTHAQPGLTCGYDLNCDAKVNSVDIGLMRAMFMKPPLIVPRTPPDGTCGYDLDCSGGNVNAVDIAIERRHYGEGMGLGAPKLLMGLGPQASGAANARLNRDAPLGMYSSWYNGPKDLNFMRWWRDSGFIANSIYATGRAAHLIIWSNVPEVQTPFGCGRPYPVSDEINADMVQLAQTWAGAASGPPLYVTLFTEFQTFPCVDNQWSGQEAYYARLQQKMMEIRDIFHQYAPNAQVSIGWGGWQRRWDDVAKGAGRSLMPHFEDVQRSMDFQSFQAMHDTGNIADVRDLTAYLGGFGPVMVAHYKPEHSTDATFLADLQTIFTDAYINDAIADRLFAWSWMDSAMFNDLDEPYQLVVDAVLRYGKAP